MDKERSNMDGSSLLAATANPYAYDVERLGYGPTRRADPRILRSVAKAVGGAASVLNIGSGTVAYEPPDRRVVTVEPSATRIEMRPAGAAPVVRGHVEALPFRDNSFAATLSVLTSQHWSDPIAGLREMARVATRRAVILTVDPQAFGGFWLFRYIPHLAFLESVRHPAISDVRDALGGDTRVETIPIPADCRDSLLGAYWRRPSMYLDRRVRQRIPLLAEIGDDDLLDGLRRLSEDIASGAWEASYGWTESLDQLDLGYRLVVAEYESPEPRMAWR